MGCFPVGRYSELECVKPQDAKTKSESGDFLKWCPFVYPCIAKCLIRAEIEQTHQARFKTSDQF